MIMLARLRRLVGRENGEGSETRERQKKDGLEPQRKPSRNKWFRGRRRSAGEQPSPQTVLTKKQKVKSLTTQLQQMTRERNELRDHLISITEGPMDNRTRPYCKPNLLFENLKRKHERVMSDLQRLEDEKNEVTAEFNELAKESFFYCNLQYQLLMEKYQMEDKVDSLKQENKKLLEYWVLLQKHLEDLHLVFPDQEEENRDLQIQEHQEKQRLEESLQSPVKQREIVNQEKNLAGNLQHHVTVSQMRSENLQHELEQPSTQDESLPPTELLQQEH
uniref:disks large homolog 5-like n=1 Tax=Myodes glareolus TaxID=447135 RepID=UPI0020201A50|nr:disks large homolog 5-like [Myodes glareolus]XP_048316445.1 disks large homolog 5-like [Myodes glareolus]